MRPTRRNVLNENTVELVQYQGGRQYFPSLPISEPSDLNNQTQILDNSLSSTKYPQDKHPYTVTIDDILDILNLQFATPQSSGAWKDELVRQAMSALRDLANYQNTGTLVIVNRNANLKKAATRGYTQLGSVLPGNLGNLPYGVSPHHPALLMTRLRGDIDPTGGGWHGVPFWVPVIRFPDGNYAFSVNNS
ncbi:MAG: hypothetical protein KME38_01815 [Spirirestis rafaelensis WJT71-NPBG6]|jgi:hypothetical protein|nr:hypothetical protein [Spirirestis rafaelensis WJT71-NPBG6]